MNKEEIALADRILKYFYDFRGRYITMVDLGNKFGHDDLHKSIEDLERLKLVEKHEYIEYGYKITETGMLVAPSVGGVSEYYLKRKDEVIGQKEKVIEKKRSRWKFFIPIIKFLTSIISMIKTWGIGN